MEKSSFLTSKLVFDQGKLIPGDAVQLIEPPHNLGDDFRRKNCLVQRVTPFSITLLIGHLKRSNEDFEYEYEEKTYPVDSFEGVGCYQLVKMVPESEKK
ncbi:hypothetical protein PP175_25200 (plasmid) [Aneurinibacillus sp. Ricciae_BoGa-3]|uniref:hypothetical protein n=1 Tax=Aneurinibacillus sp. Ricciae_BoGa-3 TaxID=3022697 RepID=UPI002341499C|nr:hypothetical protein [Aneurinibacillus sp. Ricciae_BoGa-3]WCK57366.1 hypothetical protein PP175_25200 [Aneurinibacillus sp. Ricciae_BoGa-3]